MASFNCRFILTLGNHDVKSYAPYLPHLIFESFDVHGIHCVHEPLTHGSFIAGHVHPGVKIKKGRLQIIINHLLLVMMVLFVRVLVKLQDVFKMW